MPVLPPPETAHWLAGSVALALGVLLLSEVIVGSDLYRRRRWRAYLWPSIALASGVLLWVIAIFSTFSTIHLLAHAVWAQAAMVAGAVELAVVRGKLESPRWALVTAAAFFVTGAAFLIHEQNSLLYSRAAFLHHVIGWTFVVAAIFPVGRALRPRQPAWSVGFALSFVVIAVLLFADRDAAEIFGRFGAGGP